MAKLARKVIAKVAKGEPIIIPGAEFMTKEELDHKKKNESQRRLMARRRGGEPSVVLPKHEIRKIDKAEMIEMSKDTRNLAIQTLNKKLIELYHDDEQLSKVNLATLATVFGILFDKAQLAEGLSTSNIATHTKIDINISSDKALDELNRMRQRINEEHG